MQKTTGYDEEGDRPIDVLILSIKTDCQSFLVGFTDEVGGGGPQDGEVKFFSLPLTKWNNAFQSGRIF